MFFLEKSPYTGENIKRWTVANFQNPREDWYFQNENYTEVFWVLPKRATSLSWTWNLLFISALELKFKLILSTEIVSQNVKLDRFVKKNKRYNRETDLHRNPTNIVIFETFSMSFDKKIHICIEFKIILRLVQKME